MCDSEWPSWNVSRQSNIGQQLFNPLHDRSDEEWLGRRSCKYGLSELVRTPPLREVHGPQPHYRFPENEKLSVAGTTDRLILRVRSILWSLPEHIVALVHRANFHPLFTVNMNKNPEGITTVSLYCQGIHDPLLLSSSFVGGPLS